MKENKSIYIVKTGYILPDEDACRHSKKFKSLQESYLRVKCEPEACDVCLQHNGILIPASEGVKGENLPPFHPNCKCAVEPWRIDPWQAERLVWMSIADGNMPVDTMVKTIMDFYHISEFSSQFIQRALLATGKIEDVDERMEKFIFILENYPGQAGKEAGLPGPEFSFDTFFWEPHTILTAYNQAIMQEMAYTDPDGFRRVHVDGLDEPAYMAALGSFYLKDEDGKVNPNGVLYRVYLSNGFAFYLAAGDMKADWDTNPDTHQYTNLPVQDDGLIHSDIIEFIIDEENTDEEWKRNNFKGEPDYLQGQIISMEKLSLTVLN